MRLRLRLTRAWRSATWARWQSATRSPRRGAPYTYVTTEQFLVAFDLESLQDLPDREQMEDAGVINSQA